MAANHKSIDIAISIDRVKLRAAAEAARGANLARKDKKHVPFSMNPDTVICLLDLAEWWAAASQQAERSRDDAWKVCDAAKAECVAAENRADEAYREQISLEATSRKLSDRNDILRSALEAAYLALEADRQDKSSEALSLGNDAWPLVCAALGKPEHVPGPGRCAIDGCPGYAHTAFVKGFQDAVDARSAAEAAAVDEMAKEEAPDA